MKRSGRNPGKGSFARCVEKVSRRGGVDDPRAVCAAAKMRAGEDLHNPFSVGTVAGSGLLQKINGRRRNPEDLASEAFEKFHGYPPEEAIIFDSHEHYHSVFADIGVLRELVIVPDGERRGVMLKGFHGARLSMNEAMTQLYIVGGDQSLDEDTLKLFGVKTSANHEQEILGKCVDITYYTVKTHLGREGGEADYVHAFGEEQAKGQLRIEVSPTATYDVTNEIIGLWGGQYTIKPEGIAN